MIFQVAEVVEVSIGGCGADGSSTENAWDAGEESIYDPLYASEFAHLSMADIVELSSNVEVGEMVTCEPDWEPALARMSMAGTTEESDVVGGDEARVAPWRAYAIWDMVPTSRTVRAGAEEARAPAR